MSNYVDGNLSYDKIALLIYESEIAPFDSMYLFDTKMWVRRKFSEDNKIRYYCVSNNTDVHNEIFQLISDLSEKNWFQNEWKVIPKCKNKMEKLCISLRDTIKTKSNAKLL
tara:strand:- start:1533 stop:1865 length:333 start_codon:yes stop_codon:yes gene_type:complete